MEATTKPLRFFSHYGCIFILVLQANLLSAGISWQSLPPITRAGAVSGNSMALYLSRYGLDTIGSPPIIGTFKSDSFICVGQIYRPPGQPRGTVIFLHGLFDHVGTNVNGIAACLTENYAVAAFDLPGHGLSSGARAGIGDFREYTTALHFFMEICDTLASPPYVFIGHSAGCAAALEYVASTPFQPFARMIFLAPLVRTSLYRLSFMGYKLSHRFRTASPRRFRKSSHDKEYLKRFRNDPLQPVTFPLKWAGAYYRWFDRIKDLPELELPLVVIQGDDDIVVDWRYNMRWFERKIKGLKLIKICGARHHLLNESPEYRQQCCDSIRSLIRNAL